jgi:hypothetical protein
MKAMNLTDGQTFERLEGQLIAVGEAKEVVTKYKRVTKLAYARFWSQETGEMDLTLWGDYSGTFKAGDKVVLTKVEVHVWKDNLYLSVAPLSRGGSVVCIGDAPMSDSSFF